LIFLVRIPNIPSILLATLEMSNLTENLKNIVEDNRIKITNVARRIEEIFGILTKNIKDTNEKIDAV
jgi:hypothetical protein